MSTNPVWPLEGVLFKFVKVCLFVHRVEWVGWSADWVLGLVEIAYRILSSLPRSRLAGIQRRIAPLLQFDLVGVRPSRISSFKCTH
jgi:hypothetical protein